MPASLALGIVFVESFVLYSLLRYFDVNSTKKLAERLDIQKHEINQLLTLLARRWGLGKAFRTTWILTASSIALADALLSGTVNWGVPVIALLTGTVHLLAAGSNTELEYRTRGMSREEIEAETYEFAKQLSELAWKGRLSLLTERYAFYFVVTIISLASILLSAFSDSIAALTRSSNTGAAMSNMALVSTWALLLFFPAVFLGTILWSRRLVKFYNTGKLNGPADMGGQIVELPVSIVEQALSLAKSNQTSTISLQLNATRLTETTASK